MELETRNPKLETVPVGTIEVERSAADVFVLRGGGTQLATIRRGADGWKLWLRACEIELGDRRYRTRAEMWQPELVLEDEQGMAIARDTLSGTQHTVAFEDATFVGDGSHDVERWQRDGHTVLELHWGGGYPELSAIEVLQPIATTVLVALAAFAIHSGSTRGGDRIAN